MKSFNKIHKLLFFSIFFVIILVPILVVINFDYLEQERKIKIMTWNIGGAIGVDDIFDVDRIIDEIEANDPDIIGLQEVTDEVEINEIADELNMHYFYAEAGNTDEGNVLLSKYPIINAEIIELPLIDGSRSRVLIKANIIIGDNEWEIYVSHFSRYDKPIDHYNQARFVASLISLDPSSRVILMGDLNFEPDSAPYFELTFKRPYLKDTYRYVKDDSGYTFRSNSRFKRIDYIFCSIDLTPINSKVICSEASDHCAVITTLSN